MHPNQKKESPPRLTPSGNRHKIYPKGSKTGQRLASRLIEKENNYKYKAKKRLTIRHSTNQLVLVMYLTILSYCNPHQLSRKKIR